MCPLAMPLTSCLPNLWCPSGENPGPIQISPGPRNALAISHGHLVSATRAAGFPALLRDPWVWQKLLSSCNLHPPRCPDTEEPSSTTPSHPSTSSPPPNIEASTSSIASPPLSPSPYPSPGLIILSPGLLHHSAHWPPCLQSL